MDKARLFSGRALSIMGRVRYHYLIKLGTKSLVSTNGTMLIIISKLQPL